MLKGLEVVEECGSVPQRTGPLNRVCDVLCAVMGLFFLWPILCVVAAAIKLDDGGPVLYKQVRVGRNFRRFWLWKFRSMVPGAERAGPLTSSGDTRLTRVGCLLRRYKLDELPQLFNILKGDMQLVGARPEVEQYVQMFRPQYAFILQERPGITDPATLAYRHEDQILSASQTEEQYVEQILPAKLKLSMEYQKQRSLLSDVGILLRTAAGLIA